MNFKSITDENIRNICEGIRCGINKGDVIMVEMYLDELSKWDCGVIEKIMDDDKYVSLIIDAAELFIMDPEDLKELALNLDI